MMRRFTSFLLRPTPLTQRFFQSYGKEMPSPLLHRCRSPSQRIMFSLTSTEKCYQNQNLLYYPLTFFSSNQLQYAHFSSQRNGLEVEIISKENIKPASPTPQHSKIYEVSILDQLLPNFYLPFVYFYPNNHQNNPNSINPNDLILKRRHLLKQSLSEILTKFYPLAGKVKDSRHIDCNDDGIYYVEAKVNNHFSEFLKQPDNKSMHGLLPADPNSMDLFARTDVVMIQVTVFGCGGIAIGIYTSHKIIDAFSHMTFLKAWAAAARAPSEEIRPNFISPSIFPSNPSLPENTTMVLLPIFPKQRKSSTSRFVFHASSLATLKYKSGASSRVMALTGLIWKRAMEAFKATNSTPKSSVLAFAVNIRERSSPPLPPYSIGNIFWTSAPTQCEADDDLGLDSIVQRLKGSTDKINSDFVEKMKGEEWSLNVAEYLKELKMFYSDENAEYVSVTSMCNGGIYEADFGWGKPIWASVGNADADMPVLSNFVLLMDTRSGDGIEAWVTLSEQDMVVFERDPELLGFASLNPSPLELDDQ